MIMAIMATRASFTTSNRQKSGHTINWEKERNVVGLMRQHAQEGDKSSLDCLHDDGYDRTVAHFQDFHGSGYKPIAAIAAEFGHASLAKHLMKRVKATLKREQEEDERDAKAQRKRDEECRQLLVQMGEGVDEDTPLLTGNASANGSTPSAPPPPAYNASSAGSSATKA